MKKLTQKTLKTRQQLIYAGLFALAGILIVGLVVTGLYSNNFNLHPRAASLSTLNTDNLVPILKTKYYYTFSFSGKASPKWDTARHLLEYLRSRGLDAVVIDRWYHGGWNPHHINLPPELNNYNIQPQTGYLITINNNPSVNLSDYLIPQPGPLNAVTLIPGNNFIGINYRPGIHPTAQDVCKLINSQRGSAYTIKNALRDGEGKLYWESHSCGQTTNNFNIDATKAYFVVTTAGSIFTIPDQWLRPSITPNKPRN